MTSPIKPPGGTPPGAPDPSRVDGAGRAEGPRETFREALDRTSSDAGPAGATAPPEVTGVRAISDDVRTGRIDAEAAVDRLVARALSTPAARSLTEAARAELEADLRRSLAEDPTLLALTKDLARGR